MISIILCFVIIAVLFSIMANDHVQWRRYMDAQKKWLDKFKLDDKEMNERLYKLLHDNKDEE